MADNTKIEWADATLNYVNGCTRVSPGCVNCYAERLAATRLRGVPSRAGLAEMTANGPRWTGKINIDDRALDQALRWRRPRRIFWNAHGDLFHESVPDEAIDRLFAVCALTPHHTHMILTKRAGRMREYLTARNEVKPDCPIANAAFWLNGRVRGYRGQGGLCARPLPNVWLGVSVEDQQRADERRADFEATPAAVKFVSYEPALGPVDWTGWEFVDQIIGGGESGPNARPCHPDWQRATRDFCSANSIAYFFKQWGEWMPTGSVDIYRHGPNKNQRQFPNCEGISMLVDGRHCCKDFTVAEHARRMAAREASCTRAIEVGHAALADFHATLDLTTGPVNPLGYQWLYRVGKKAAGRLLDGIEHNAFPKGEA